MTDHTEPTQILNVTFPYNTVIGLTSGSASGRAVVLALDAIHDQLCVIANLLRDLTTAVQPAASEPTPEEPR